MAQDKTSHVIARDLAPELAARTSLAVVAGADTSGNPTLAVGTQTAASQATFIRIKPVDTLQTNALGSTQTVFAPHVIQMVLEATAASATVALMTAANIMKIVGPIDAKGCKVELYLTANATPVSLDAITGTPALEYWPDLYYTARNAT